MKILTVFGTRPEAIKMAPIVYGLSQQPERFESVVCVTAQHREMLDQVLSLFQIQPDYDLDVMRPNQDLFQVTSTILTAMKPVLEAVQPDMVLVQGDTTTAMVVSLAAFYLKIPVGHVEAGLRTHQRYYPFPEEINRVLADAMATLHFAPTARSKQNLLANGIQEASITLTGNTVIDALFHTLKTLETNPLPVDALPVPLTPADNRRRILVTMHRRENFGEPLLEICDAILELLTTHPDVEVVLPVHPNPNVRSVVHQQLGNHQRIALIEPLEYAPFCQLMASSTLILTDSGGVQEEAPSLSKPVLVLRDETERPEAVEMGTVKLVGPHKANILREANQLLSNPEAYQAMARTINPYGDGHATQKILNAIHHFGQG